MRYHLTGFNMRRGLSQTLRHLSQARLVSSSSGVTVQSVLNEVKGFGANPGRLIMRAYAPTARGGKSPLVVVLHGCTQSAEIYARGAGWIEAADQHGFVLLCPEQSAGNNPNLCFNWFVSEDIRRGGGEAASIAQMIAHTIATHDVDPSNVYITGLSAGGAMANVMLATYPELFKAGAIIAGLPYGSAANVQEAFAAMAHRGHASDPVLGERVRTAGGSYRGPWPTIAVWHGDRDMTVAPGAGEAIVRQWVNVHGATPAPPTTLTSRGHQTWVDAAGAIVVEHHAIHGMGHGTPLKTRGVDAIGMTGPYLLDVGVSSTLEILHSWGLASRYAQTGANSPKSDAIYSEDVVGRPAAARHPRIDVGAVINDALRSAGLLK